MRSMLMGKVMHNKVKVGDLFKIKRVLSWDPQWNVTAGYTVKVLRIVSKWGALANKYIRIQYIHHPELNTYSDNGIKYRWVLLKRDITTGLERVSEQLEFAFMNDTKEYYNER